MNAMTIELFHLRRRRSKSVNLADSWNPYGPTTSKKLLSGIHGPLWRMAISLMLATLVRNRDEIPRTAH